MSRFTVILPEGTVILKNEETGQILRLSAESGPLVLGEIEMSMTLGPSPNFERDFQKASFNCPND